MAIRKTDTQVDAALGPIVPIRRGYRRAVLVAHHRTTEDSSMVTGYTVATIFARTPAALRQPAESFGIGRLRERFTYRPRDETLAWRGFADRVNALAEQGERALQRA